VPVAIEAASAEAAVASLRERRLRRGSIRERGKRLRIGLVNNMPDAAWLATERQFAGLLNDAAEDFDVRLSLWTLETLDRQQETRRAMAGKYRAARDLRGAECDALIVTGAEPRALDLRQEPYWRELTALFDWAEARTFSTVLSCLAAHASVLHRDGIVRRRLAAKCSGVFATELVARHEIVEGFGPANSMPHSRWNGLDEDELAAKGYLTLTRSDRAGVDIFVRDGLSLQVFLQGHPEYDADTLAREYRRDLLRFLGGATSAPPQIPHDYFPPPLAELLAAFAERAASTADDPGSNFPSLALAITSASWRGTSVRLFRNWLAAVARRKAALSAPSSAARRGG
jgi:homoserine O-succinyltransferase/O-acetyltransferase